MADRNIDESRIVTGPFSVEGMQLEMLASNLVKPFSLPGRIDPFAESSAQEYPLGTILKWRDREFRYALAGTTALAVGKLMQSVVPLAGHIDEVINSPAAAATTINFTPAVVTTDDIAANEFADGYLHINDDTGEGYMFAVRSHPAITGGVVGTLTLYDPIVLTVGDAATATLIHNRFRKVIIHDSPQTAMLAGVTVRAVTASYYCWLQTKGPCAVLTQGTLVIGDFCVPSATVDGAVMPSAAVETDGPPVGHVMAVNADTEYSAIWLDLP